MRVPKRVEKLYIVVRQDDEVGPSYAPNRFEQRSKKFFSLAEARRRKADLKGKGKLFEADVSEWREVDTS